MGVNNGKSIMLYSDNMMIDVFSRAWFLSRCEAEEAEQKVIETVKVPGGWFRKPVIEKDIVSVYSDEYEATREKLRGVVQLAFNCFPRDDFGGPETITFDRLWDFCDFVHYAERIIFYPNKERNKLYVYPYNEHTSERHFHIRENSYYQMEIVLEKVKEEIYSTDKIVKAIHVHIFKFFTDDQEEMKKVYVDEIACHKEDATRLETLEAMAISDLIYESCFSLFKDIINSLLDKHGIAIS